MLIMKKQKKIYTCVFVRENNNILLGFKKRGLLEGKWNGFGGKVEPGETILEAALRELHEECGLKSEELFENGLLTVELGNEPNVISEVFIFTSTKFTGIVTESNEMIPKWFDINHIPFEQMCYDGRFWLPLLLEGKKFDAYFQYDKKGDVLDQNIKVLN